MSTSKNHFEILFVTSYPPRECGIATYSQDVMNAITNKFGKSLKVSICALENDYEQFQYPQEVKYKLNTSRAEEYVNVADQINATKEIDAVMVQHEFGFYANHEHDFLEFLYRLSKPACLSFHTVLPGPNENLKANVKNIVAGCQSVVVMTKNSKDLLVEHYGITEEKIEVIPHGTHLVKHASKNALKSKYNLLGKKVLSTFGLLGSGKRIETTIEALPAIVKENPNVVFLVIGKTHPIILKNEGEVYRQSLQKRIKELNLEEHVKFVNKYVALDELLEYLQLTDIYLFTSSDPNQAVSGTFSYAMSCGCAIVSTPIPHAKEMLQNGAGMLVDFGNSRQLSETVIRLLRDPELRRNTSLNALHTIASTAWENSAIAHALLFEKLSENRISLRYDLPKINLEHVKNMTTDVGMIQFSKLNQPDIDSGYTLDDNARAMVAMCQHYELTRDQADLEYIRIYLEFIKFCLQEHGYFLNYVNEKKAFTQQNNSTNLADANGRAIWALGYLISLSAVLPADLRIKAKVIMNEALLNVHKIHSTRAMAFIIKGLYYKGLESKSVQNESLIRELANRMVQMYRHESVEGWLWFESYLTYANSILPEALLCAWMATGENVYKEIAKTSFDFLLSKTFREGRIQVVLNKHWMMKNVLLDEKDMGGEQPIDVAYTILALSKFYNAFGESGYREKMDIAFNWFLGHNHLHQIIYNPCTGGCYDGLEEHYVNLNQGAESTVSYIMARLVLEKYQSVGRDLFESVKPDLVEEIQLVGRRVPVQRQRQIRFRNIIYSILTFHFAHLFAG